MLFAIVCLLTVSSCLINADTDFDVVVKLENGGSATIRGNYIVLLKIHYLICLFQVQNIHTGEENS